MRISVGDVFQVPISASDVGFGQVVAKCKPIYYMIAFDCIRPIAWTVQIEEVVKAPIILAGNFFDSLLRIGVWETIENVAPNMKSIPFPCFKILIEGKYYVDSWDRKRRRLATPAEIDLLDHPTNDGAMWLQEALQAHFGVIPYDSKYERFGISYVLARDLE